MYSISLYVKIPLRIFIKIHTTFIALGILLQNLTLRAKDKYFKYLLICLNHETLLNTNSLAFMACPKSLITGNYSHDVKMIALKPSMSFTLLHNKNK